MNRLKRAVVLLEAMTFLGVVPNVRADTNFVSFQHTLSGTNLTLHFDLTPDNGNYYILDQSTNLVDFTPVLMSYGGGTNAWGFTADVTQSRTMFWRVRRIPASSPLDTDGDGIDDLFELSHGLNPLNSSDANQNSGLFDASGNPLTWLQAYLYFSAHHLNIFDIVGREGSVFNFGQPTANYEALSREFSAFNSPPDSDGDGIDDIWEINHNLNPLNPADAGLLSGFTDDNGHPLTWLQLYRYNFGANRILYDAESREVSVFNFGAPTANYEAISREVSVSNSQ